MSFRHLLKYGLSLPPHIAAFKAIKLIKNRLLGRWQSRNLNTYTQAVHTPIKTLGHFVSSTQAQTPDNPTFDLAALSSLNLAHKFNLLGSGWTTVEASPELVESSISKGNRARSSQLRSLLSKGYKPIDWQLDFRSGYRWSEGQRSLSIAYGHEPGVDIKVPWELARLQHLPQLAFAYSAATKAVPGFAEAQIYFKEFQNQALDFMAANPPGYGVNWVCTMDVAIRAANMILAFDLFRAQGATFDQGFIDEFAAAIQSHGVHISQNLEWHKEFRANHYLADITGLLFVAAFLPSDPTTDSWLAFATQEFKHEIGLQFLPDGGNAEASTNYHRLSAEMAVYGTALVLGLKTDRQAALHRYDPRNGPTHSDFKHGPVDWLEESGCFSVDHFALLRRMAEFTIDITKPDGHVVQVGDTDNGRFFKLSPVMIEPNLEEDQLDHRHLIAAVGSLLDDTGLLEYAGDAYQGEAEIIRQLKGNSPQSSDVLSAKWPLHIDQELSGNCSPEDARKLVIELPSPELLQNLTRSAYPDFGLYIWRSERFFLSVRCGPIGQGGNGGHAHNDQLAIELQVDGEDWIADPGSYTYTADTKKRDQYRSHHAHAVPRFRATEPSRLNLGLFRLENNAHAQCLEFSETTFCGVHYGYDTPTYRHLRLVDNQIEVTDSFGDPVPPDQKIEAVVVRSGQELRNYFDLTLAFSPGYGQRD